MNAESRQASDVLADLLGDDESFFSRGVSMPPLLDGRATSARVYSTGSGTFALTFGELGHETSLWTTEAGLRALIGDLQATLARADGTTA